MCVKFIIYYTILQGFRCLLCVLVQLAWLVSRVFRAIFGRATLFKCFWVNSCFVRGLYLVAGVL